MQHGHKQNWGGLSLDILDRNLNDLPYTRFFEAFGYHDQDSLFLRAFKDKDKGEDKGIKDQVKTSLFDHKIRDLKNWNEHDRGIFFVVNGGGHSDKDVRDARAQFIDFDDYTFQEQIRRLNQFTLEPSIIIKTKKSLHCYWLLKDGNIKVFRNIQQRLIQYFGSDKSIINESRVMRLYGFEHRKMDPVMVTLIKFNPDIRYTQKQLADCLPNLKHQTKTKPKQKQEQSQVNYGERYPYLISRAGMYVNKLGNEVEDSYIWELVKQDYLQHCEHLEDDDLIEIEERIIPAIRKFRENDQMEKEDPTFWKYAMKAWLAENPGKVFDSNTIPWGEVAEAGHRAKDAGKTFHPAIPQESGQEKSDSNQDNPDQSPGPDLKQFHHWKKDNPTRVFHKRIRDYLKSREDIFILGDIPYLYRDGVYRPNKNGSQLKTMIESLIYEEFATYTTIENVYKMFFQDHDLQIKSIEELNNHPKHWINFKNGFFDPIGKRFIAHDPKYLSINQIPHDYTATGDLKGDEIEKWLDFITPDPDDREMLLQFFGYCMTADMDQEVFLILTGTGGTGKSTLIRMLETMIGQENISHISMKRFEDRFSSYGLLGKLVNSCADLEIGALSDVSLLKQITGEDTILVEAKGKDAIFIKSYAKLIFSCNELPIVKAEKTNGIYRRLLILSMNKTPEIKRTDYFKTLQQQLPYFIRLCVEALERMRRDGQILRSANSDHYVMELWKESDTVQAFIEECCEKAFDKRTSRATVYSAYVSYCEGVERTALKNKGFFSSLRMKGYDVDKMSNGIRYVTGLYLDDKYEKTITDNITDRGGLMRKKFW